MTSEPERTLIETKVLTAEATADGKVHAYRYLVSPTVFEVMGEPGVEYVEKLVTKAFTKLLGMEPDTLEWTTETLVQQIPDEPDHADEAEHADSCDDVEG